MSATSQEDLKRFIEGGDGIFVIAGTTRATAQVTGSQIERSARAGSSVSVFRLAQKGFRGSNAGPLPSTYALPFWTIMASIASGCRVAMRNPTGAP